VDSASSRTRSAHLFTFASRAQRIEVRLFKFKNFRDAQTSTPRSRSRRLRSFALVCARANASFSSFLAVQKTYTYLYVSALRNRTYIYIYIQVRGFSKTLTRVPRKMVVTVTREAKHRSPPKNPKFLQHMIID